MSNIFSLSLQARNFWSNRKAIAILLFLLWNNQAVKAQVIPSAANTEISTDNEVTTVSGGHTSNNNLFHEFEQFNIDTDRKVNFATTSDINNVISRVGGSASFIDGTLGIVGSEANLYLINPSGILFGPNAQLNLPRNFTAATATSIGFDEQWLPWNETTSQSAELSKFINDPKSFSFLSDGAIVNRGALSVNAGQSISLMAGTVVNTGQLRAPDGSISITAVEPGRMLRLNQANSLLSIEVVASQAELLPLSTSLGELLTGNVDSADTLTVDADGTVSLTQSGLSIFDGTDNSSCHGCLVASGTLDVDGAKAGGEINLLGSYVGLFNSTLTANGEVGGGILRVGGDYQGGTALPTARQTYVDAASLLTADAIGTGNGGNVYLWSDEDTQFYGHLSSQGGSIAGNGGFAEISGKQNLVYQGSVDLSAAQGQDGTLLFDPSTIIIRNGAGTDTPTAPSLPSILNNSENASTPFVLYEENLENVSASAIALQASEDIIIEDLLDNKLALNSGIELNLLADADGNGSGSFIMQGNSGAGRDSITGVGSVTISGTNLDIGSIVSDQSGDVVLTAQNNITTGDIRNSEGNLEIESTNGSIDTTGGTIGGSRGNLTLLAANDISTSDIRNDEGNLEIESANGGIDTTGGTVEGSKGNLTLLAQSDISSEKLINREGNLSITSTNGDIVAESIHNVESDILIDSYGNFRVTGSVDASASEPISIEASPGKTINITQGSGANPSFFVGDASINGTSHRISNQETVLEDVELPGSFVDGSIERSTSAPLQSAVPLVTPPTQPTTTTTTSTSTTTTTTTTTSTSTSTSTSISTTSTSTTSTPTTQTAPTTSTQTTRTAPTSTTSTPTTSTASSSVSLSDSVVSASTIALGKESSPNIALPIDKINDVSEVFESIETTFGERFNEYLRLAEEDDFITEIATLQQARETLREAEQMLDVDAALLYVHFPTNGNAAHPDDPLEVLLITPYSEPLAYRHPNVTRAQTEVAVKKLRYETARQFSRDYLTPAQQLYEWFIAPVESALEQENIDNISFILDDGLRTVPIAVLHDGDRYILEQYSLSLLPTFSLTNFSLGDRSTTAEEMSVLAMGASTFKDQSPLPAVEAEIAFISKNNLAETVFLNEDFTVNNFETQLNMEQYDVVHLATHATFEAGDLENSYIQFWEERLPLSQIHGGKIESADINLIILSACNTALGSLGAEYGFAGFSVKAGSKASLASLWSVSDEGTFGFMTQFYRHLTGNYIQAEALRRTQLSMIRGEVGVSYGDVYGPDNEIQAFIPQLAESGSWDFSHPYYWSAFTMIGSPW